MKRTAACLLAALVCALPLQAQTVVPGGLITTDTNWNLAGSPYEVQGTLTVIGSSVPRLTVEAGVEVRFVSGAGLVIGGTLNTNSHAGELVAQGTSSLPILFTAESGASGDWEGLRFNAGSQVNGSQSMLDWCIVEKADDQNLILRQTTQPATIQDCVFREAAGYGVTVEQCYPPAEFIDCSIVDNGAKPLLSLGAELPVLNGVSTSGNLVEEVEYTGTISGDVTLDPAGYPLPVYFSGLTAVLGVDVPTLTLAPGSLLEFESGASLRIGGTLDGANSHRGQLHAVGSADSLITLQARSGVDGDWKGLWFRAASDLSGATSSMAWCVVRQGEDWNLRAETTSQPDSIAHCLFENATGHGLSFYQCYPPSRLVDVTIEDNADVAIELAGSALVETENLSWSGNGAEEIVYNGNITGDVELDLLSYPHPVYFDGIVSVQDNSVPTLTIPPGNTLEFESGASLRIGGTLDGAQSNRGQLVAVGTADSLITLQPRSGLDGDWDGLWFRNASDFDGATSEMAWCVVRQGEDFNLRSESTSQPAAISDCVFEHSTDAGVSFYQCYPPSVLVDCQLLDNAGPAMRCEGADLVESSNLGMSGNGGDELEYTGHIVQDVHFDLPAYPHPVVFRETTWVYGLGSARLSLSPGSVLHFDAHAELQIGGGLSSSSNAGRLEAVGTADSLIVFTGPSTGEAWDGLRFRTGSDTDGSTSTMNWCRVEYAEDGLRCEETDQPALQYCELVYSRDNALELFEATPTVQSSAFLFSGGSGVQVQNTVDCAIGDSSAWTSTLANNGAYDLEVLGSGDVYARYNDFCSVDGTPLSARIWDVDDDPSVGEAFVLPLGEGDFLYAFIETTDTEIELVWCPVAGATSYDLYTLSTPWEDIDSLSPTLNTTDTQATLPLPSADAKAFYVVRANLAAASHGDRVRWERRVKDLLRQDNDR